MVASEYNADSYAQPDGSVYVYERHTDATGFVHVRMYLAPPSWGPTEYAAHLSNESVRIDEQLAQRETDALMGS